MPLLPSLSHGGRALAASGGKRGLPVRYGDERPMTAEHAYQWCGRRECQRCSDYRIGVREGIQAGYLDLLTLHEK